MRMDTNVVIKRRLSFLLLDHFRNLIRIQGQVLGKVVFGLALFPHDPRVICAQLGYPRVGAFASVAMARV
jgi:hypothetical protein